MYSFKYDYSEGCHPNILDTLSKTNFEQQDGYGEDAYSIQARTFIQKKLENHNAEIFFVSGGTQANLIVIAAALRPHESVIAAVTGHIHVHEAGSIEATGHKINALATTDGKLSVEDIQTILEEHTEVPHVVKPKLVYISNSTEIGSIYSKEELQKLSTFCKSQNLYLFMDGARLASALTAENNNLTLADLSKLTDAFYIGGTKNGALLGEAVVINHPELQNVLGFHLKQRGALLAKGRILGIQFYELFKDDLFFTLAKHANYMANKIRKTIKLLGYDFLTDSPSNQIFPILPNELIAKLHQNYDFYVWKKIDQKHSAVRIVTSWTTPEAIVDQFIEDLKLRSKQ
jgi:threonine aldolase